VDAVIVGQKNSHEKTSFVEEKKEMGRKQQNTAHKKPIILQFLQTVRAPFAICVNP